MRNRIWDGTRFVRKEMPVQPMPKAQPEPMEPVKKAVDNTAPGYYERWAD
jgi:hypothetical protein